MENIKQGILPKNFSVNEKYSIMLFIKQGSNAETYRVKGKDGKISRYEILEHKNYINGKEADCRNVILIMTSNLGAKDAERNTIGFSTEERFNDGEEATNNFFAPEFRNRLDGIIKFTKLSKNNMERIVHKFIDELNLLIREKNIKIQVTDTGMSFLTKKGFNPKMGARPLARIIDQEIKKPMSREMLFGKLKNGGNVIVDASDKDVILTYQSIEDHCADGIQRVQSTVLSEVSLQDSV
jgi:hypothetical protein